MDFGHIGFLLQGGDDLVRRLAACLRVNGLPTRCSFDAEALADAALSDKKRAGASITLVLPEDIGRYRLEKISVGELKGTFERALSRMEAMAL